MKGFARLVLTLGIVVALPLAVGCSKQSQAPAQGQSSQNAQQSAPAKQNVVEKIKKEGKLVVGTSADYPPFESLDKENKIVGFDIDLAGEIAKKLGAKLEVLNIQFDGLIPALNGNKFDIMVAGVTITEERKKNVDFSTPYMSGGNAIVVQKDTKDTIKELKDLKGKTIAVQLGSAQDAIAQKVPDAVVKRYPLYTDAAMAVSNKQVYAMILHKVVANAFTAQDPNLKIAAEVEPIDTGLVFRKDSPELREAANQVLEEMKKDGRMDALVKKWFK